MARPLSPEKRSAILSAAAEVVAEAGVSAATSAIAKAAGVAEGTLFTYFPTKDNLLNALYLQLKSSLHGYLASGFAPGGEIVDRCRSIWEGYIAWGRQEPLRSRALKQLAVSSRITEDSRNLGRESLALVSGVLRECSTAEALKNLPKNYVSNVMTAMAEVTLDWIAAEPSKASRHIRAGFELFWRAIGQTAPL